MSNQQRHKFTCHLDEVISNQNIDSHPLPPSTLTPLMRQRLLLPAVSAKFNCLVSNFMVTRGRPVQT